MELFSRTYAKNFPTKYAPLKNTKVDITQLEEFKSLKDYYEELEKESNVEEPTEVEEENKGTDEE